MNRYLFPFTKKAFHFVEVGQKWQFKENGEIIEIYDASGIQSSPHWEILTTRSRTVISERLLRLQYKLVNKGEE